MFDDEEDLVLDEIDELVHYGMPRRSGRYPWGSGKDPHQHSSDFLSRISELQKQGHSEKDIADAMGLSTGELRKQKSAAKAERRADLVATARGLREKGHSLNEIASQMGFKNDSSVRTLLDSDIQERSDKARNTANFLKERVKDVGMVDVSKGVERYLGISKEKLQQSLEVLKGEGYEVYNRKLEQVTNKGKFTTMTILCPPGTEYKDVYKTDKIHSIENFTSHDNGQTFDAMVYPASMDSKRLMVRYAEDGGIHKDGVVEIRRNVPDLSLGNSHYAQVRILVDGKKYIKGMAVYSDDMPPGVDIIFNTNKSKNVPKLDVLKNIESNPFDPNNPFGSLIKANGQSYYTDKDGKRKLSLINKRSEEGDWDAWSKNLPSQFLAKQNKELIDKQIKLTERDKMAEFDEIMSLTNPTVKRHLLDKFASGCDTAASHLKVAPLPRQRYQVLLPITDMKDNEIYAPNFKNGEKVALVRFPHGGIFEIPVLTVNNKHANAKKTLGNALDAVGINSKIAEQLSGADFDGDTALVIPTNHKVKISNDKPLRGLVGFDPKDRYPYREGMKVMTKNATQNQMGMISNLITDMTVKGATEDELARAVRHSMVVIDAAKHKLDYKQSEKDNNIDALKKKYQYRVDENGKTSSGAATLFSRANADYRVPKTKGGRIINKETGEVSYKIDPDAYYTDAKGKPKVRTKTSTAMQEVKDAYDLVSDSRNVKERAYADYANKMKALANRARKEMLATPRLNYSKAAEKTYSNEVASLNAKLILAEKNAPKERLAQAIANTNVSAKLEFDKNISKAEEKKIRQQAITIARAKVGAQRHPIDITPKEWEAIQAGAISDTKLTKMLNNSNIDKIREYATPRTATQLSPAKISKMSAMRSSGYTTDEIASALGVSGSTVIKYIKHN